MKTSAGLLGQKAISPHRKPAGIFLCPTLNRTLNENVIYPAHNPQVCPVLQSLWVCWELRWLLLYSLCCVRCCLLLFCILLQICFSTDWKKSTNGVLPMRKLWSGCGGKRHALIFLQILLMAFILKSTVVLRFIWIKTTSSFWTNFDKVQRQYMPAMVSSAWLPGSPILQVAGWLFHSYFTSAETIDVKITNEKALCQFFPSQNYASCASKINLLVKPQIYANKQFILFKKRIQIWTLTWFKGCLGDS